LRFPPARHHDLRRAAAGDPSLDSSRSQTFANQLEPTLLFSVFQFDRRGCLTGAKALGSPSRASEHWLERQMGSTKDKITGMANEAAGNIKQGVGKAVGSEKLQAEGKLQEIKGESQRAVGAAKDAIKDSATKAAAAINNKL
jgi:uncharacterized protein YjbJ (UPF0337 family)